MTHICIILGSARHFFIIPTDAHYYKES